MTPSPSDIEMLSRTRTIDLTTIGRRTGEPRTVEIWWFHVDGRFIITGTPGRRDWLANVRANPAVVVSAHGQSFSASTSEIEDADFKRRVFTDPQIGWYRTQADLDHLVETAPMIEVTFPDIAGV
jgi:deazaflavin-dependent oxidoreductase (nitroreductase family)